MPTRGRPVLASLTCDTPERPSPWRLGGAVVAVLGTHRLVTAHSQGRDLTWGLSTPGDDPPVRSGGAATYGEWASTSAVASLAHLLLDVGFGDRPSHEDLPTMENQSDTPAGDHPSRPEVPTAGHGPHADEEGVDDDVGNEVRPEVSPGLESFSGLLVSSPRSTVCDCSCSFCVSGVITTSLRHSTHRAGGRSPPTPGSLSRRRSHRAQGPEPATTRCPDRSRSQRDCYGPSRPPAGSAAASSAW